jgi:hypothetical protein
MGADPPERAGFCRHNLLDAGCGRSHGLISACSQPQIVAQSHIAAVGGLAAYNWP